MGHLEAVAGRVIQEIESLDELMIEESGELDGGCKPKTFVCN